MSTEHDPVISELLSFPLLAALFGRRARRFAVGAELPDGPLAFRSKEAPEPLSELERLLVLTAAGGSTGWHYMITRHARYAPHLSNYSGAAGGRTFPSAAGIHTTELFFTDDSGTYLAPMRDAPAVAEPDAHGPPPLEQLLRGFKRRIRKLSDERLHLPREEPYMEGHNTWCVNVPGSLLVIPVADVAQHQLALMGFLTQNGYCIQDDVTGKPIQGLEQFGDLVDLEHPYPLSFIEQYALTEVTAELSTSCFAGMLMLQAMGLGGWMFDGLDRFSVLGASGVDEVPGLGFRYDKDPRWPLPNPTGREGVFEAFCPPHFPNMRAAIDALAQRKFGPGGPYHPDTPGPWKDSRKVRSSALPYDERFRECMAVQAQHIYDQFGKFPGTTPSVFCLTYLQAHHLDTGFYDHHFKAGAYLETHAKHRERWHRTH